jgi:hypothetical protein
MHGSLIPGDDAVQWDVYMPLYAMVLVCTEHLRAYESYCDQRSLTCSQATQATSQCVIPAAAQLAVTRVVHEKHFHARCSTALPEGMCMLEAIVIDAV